MIFTFFLSLNVLNLILFFIVLFGEDLKIYNFFGRLYKFITVPMLLYSVFYLLYVIYNRVGIYLNMDMFIMTIVICSINIIGNIGKIIRICIRGSSDIIDFSGLLDILMLATALFGGIFIVSELILGFIKIDERSINLEKIQFKEIVYTDLSDKDDNDDKNQITVILNENNDRIEIDLDDCTLEEFEYNRTEKYIKKSAKYSKTANIFGKTHESEEYKYSIYTGDKEEYDLLKKLSDD